MEKPFWLACFTHMFLETFLLIQIVLIPVLAREFGLSLLEASLVVTIPMAVQLATNIPAGMLAGRVRTRYLLFASMIIEGTAALFLSQTSNFWTLVFGVCVMRVSSPIYHISGLNRISNLVKREQLSRSMGFHNALGNLGSAIGTISLSLFLPTLGWRWTYLFWAPPLLAWGLIILRSKELDAFKAEEVEEKKPSTKTSLSTVFSSSFLVFLAAVGFRAIGVVGANTFIPTYFVMQRNLMESTASLIFGLGPFMGIVGSLIAGSSGDRIGAKKILGLAILSCAFALLVFSIASDLYILIPAYLVLAFFNSIAWTPMNTMVADMMPVRARGLGFSMYFLIEGVIEAVSPTIAARLIDLSSIVYLFPFSLAMVIVGLVILQFLRFPKNIASADQSSIHLKKEI
jgi:AAHS family cis,cis-muconate transporter-like MFS transporter